MRSVLFPLLFFGLSLGLLSCSGDSPSTTSSPVATDTPAEDDGTGVGPISSVTISAGIDEQMALRGQQVFEAKCAACHQFEERYVGPSVGGITERREPEWIMNMILNPEEMTQKDPVAKGLLKEYMTQMTYQDVSEEDARAILEYFRQYDNELLSQH